MGLDLSPEVRIRTTDEPVHDLIDGQLPAEFGQHPPVDLDRQRLAVDQDAVAVEDDQIDGFRQRHQTRSISPRNTS